VEPLSAKADCFGATQEKLLCPKLLLQSGTERQV